jgi:hypothetical protein
MTDRTHGFRPREKLLSDVDGRSNSSLRWIAPSSDIVLDRTMLLSAMRNDSETTDVDKGGR